MHFIPKLEIFEEIDETGKTDTKFKMDMSVLIRVAKAFYENQSMKKTHLFSVSRTNWRSFDKYFSWLEKKNYVQCNTIGNIVYYQLTENGRAMFDTLLKFQEYIK